MRFIFLRRENDTQTAYFPVSYTHLDVYKRQNHIWLLSKYIKPAKVEYDDDQSYVVKEHLCDAIDRFIQEGMLINCELKETLYCVMTIADLKAIAKEENFKLSGTKTELVDRFLSANYSKAEKLVSKIKTLKCSQLAKDFLKKYQQEQEIDINLAKTQSFQALLESDSKKSYKIFLLHKQKRYPTFEENMRDFRKIDFILTSKPKVLGNISQQNLIWLRAAACMSELWLDESAENWLSKEFVSPLKNNQTAINHLKYNAEIRRRIAQKNNDSGNKEFKLIFYEDEYEIDSCSLCLNLKDKIFKAKDFPELPIENCTSEKAVSYTHLDVYKRQ